MNNKTIDNQRYVLILGVILIVSLFLYALRSVLLPFVVGIVLAYFLNPLVNKLSKNKPTDRTLATVGVMGIMLLILLPLLLLLGSAIFSQVVDFANKVPEYANIFVKRIMLIIHELQDHFAIAVTQDVEQLLQKNMASAVSIMLKIAGRVISNGFEFINLMSLLLISPVVAFYMLRDWNQFTAKIEGLIPQKHKENLLSGINEVNNIISGYLRGQFLVCIVLGTYYSFGLWAINLDLGLLVGFLAGIISFIPYVGSISGFLMAMALAITQYGSYDKILAVVIVFGIGQFVEGNFLTPKLVGENIGLHPVWVMFALLAGGVLLGLLGMIIAVPLAAIIGVMLRYLIANYKNSPLYLAK